MDIFKNNNKIKSFPLIFISNNQHSKLLNDLKKSCKEIIFNNPTNEELKQLIRNISISEKIIWENESLIDKLILFAQNDIRRLINLFQELSYHLTNGRITNLKIDEFIEKSREKNIDVGLFDSTERILNNYLDYDTIIKLYESEKVLLPLMIHENYLKKILNKSKDSWQNIIYNIVKVSDSLSRGDNIETSIYTDQNWYLQNIHGFFTCINTSYWINKNNSKNKIDINDIKKFYPSSKIINFSSYYVYDSLGLCTEDSATTNKYNYCRQKLIGESLNTEGLNFRIGKLFGNYLSNQNFSYEYTIHRP